MARTKKPKPSRRTRDQAEKKAKNMNPKASKRRQEKLKARTASTAIALEEGQVVGSNTRSRVRRRELNGLMGEMESFSICSTAELAVTSSSRQQGTTTLHTPLDRLRKGDRLTSTPANNYFHRQYLSAKENINREFALEHLKDWIGARAAEARAKLDIRALSEKKRQLSRILTFLETHLATRDAWTEAEFRELLDQIDEGEAKRAVFQPTLTKAQAKQQRSATHRSAQEHKKFAQETKNRERKEEESLACLLGDFGLQAE